MINPVILEEFLHLVRISYRAFNAWALLVEPGPAKVLPLREEDNNMLVYSVGFVPTAVDVVKAVFVSEVDGVASDPVECKLGETVEMKWEQDKEVILKQVQIDDANNPSPEHVQKFVATDTIAPPEAGDAAVTLIREE